MKGKRTFKRAFVAFFKRMKALNEDCAQSQLALRQTTCQKQKCLHKVAQPLPKGCHKHVCFCQNANFEAVLWCFKIPSKIRTEILTPSYWVIACLRCSISSHVFLSLISAVVSFSRFTVTSLLKVISSILAFFNSLLLLSIWSSRVRIWYAKNTNSGYIKSLHSIVELLNYVWGWVFLKWASLSPLTSDWLRYKPSYLWSNQQIGQFIAQKCFLSCWG